MKLYRFNVTATYEVGAESKEKAEEVLADALPPREDDDGIFRVAGKMEYVGVSDI